MSFESIMVGLTSFDSIFVNLLNASISSCWLVGAVLLFRFVFKKAPKWLTVALWALVAVRLICPVPIESSLSLVPAAEPLPAEVLNIDPHKGVESTTVEIINNPVYSEYVDSSVSVDVERFQWDAVRGGLAWLYGMGAMVLYALFSYLRIYLKVRQSMLLKENIYLCDRINTPFIFGIIRPKIYLPSFMDEGDMTYVLAHERAHIKRKDYLWKPLGFLILTVYWFNPVIWLSYILMCKDIELACDEKVIKEMGAEIKKPYSVALINCSVPKRMITACPVAFGETGVKKRIKAVLSYKKPALWLIIMALVTGVILAVCFATSPEREAFTPERNYLIETNEGKEMFRFNEVIEYSEYFTVHKGVKSWFKATPGSGRSTVLNFLSSLSLERLPEMKAEGLSQSGKIEVVNSDGNIEVIFCDGFSKMFLRSGEGSTLTESSLYAVDKEKVKEFFDEEKYIKQGNIWECDFTSSAWGHGEIHFYFGESVDVTAEPDVEGGRVEAYTSDEYGHGYVWIPEITEEGVGESALISFEVTALGKKDTYQVKIVKVGENEGLASYFLITAEDTVVSAYSDYEYRLSSAVTLGQENEWYYNPNLSSKGYGSLSFSLPTEYKLVSVDCPKGRAEIDYKYYLEPEGEKLVYWAPDFDTYLTDESYEITINALKKGENVTFTVKFIGTEKTDEMRGRRFKIEPVNCIAINKGWADYELHEAENASASDLDEAVSKAILDINSQGKWLGECPAEGHVIFGTKEKDGIVTVYMIERYSNYGFENGWFISKSGHIIPAVMRFEKKDGQYTFLDVEYAQDGSRYTSSIKKMFPKIYEGRALSPTDSDNQKMREQLDGYARAYLDSIGRTEPIGTYSDLNTVLLTDVGVSVEVSNKLLGLKVNYDTGKIGWFEQIENGVRYIYRTSYFPEKNLITYTKEVYGTGEIKEKMEVDSLTGNIITVQSSPEPSFTFDAEVLDVSKNGDWLLVKPLEGTAERNSSDKIQVPTVGTELEGRTDIKKGTKVRIMYDGMIQESYPAQLNDVFAIYLHSALPDNRDKQPTTKAYYITE